MSRQGFADQGEGANVDRLDAVAGRGVLKEAVAAKLRHQFAAGGIDIAMIDVRRVPPGPAIDLPGQRPVLLTEERPMEV
jgi:hypothetical protein